MKNSDKIIKRSSDLAWRVIDNEAVILPLDKQVEDSEKINFLNPTGTRIWALIDGKNTVGDIIKKICDEYEIEYKEAEKEVVSFMRKLKDKKLIQA